MKKVILLVILTTIALTGCIGHIISDGPGTSETQIMGDYYLVKTEPIKASLVKITQNRKSVETQKQIVPKTVTGLFVVDGYILAKQKPYDLVKKELVKDETYYYIINHSTGEVKGPLSLTEFRDLLKRLGVTIKVRFEDSKIINEKID
ncbi:DUF3997 domain-containing protein [Actinomycetes bacterium NPDC127524]